MQLNAAVFDVWVYRKDHDAVRYLLLHTSQEKADRWFNGGRFWQIPSEAVQAGEELVPAVRRSLAGFGVVPVSVWAAEHSYTIYNPRFAEVQIILVLAAEVTGDQQIHLGWEHSEYRWCTAGEADGLLGFRGLKEGLSWVRRVVAETGAPLPELRLG